MALNKGPIIILYALHFPEFPIFAALQMHTLSTYDAWTLTQESQQTGDVNQEKQKRV